MSTPTNDSETKKPRSQYSKEDLRIALEAVRSGRTLGSVSKQFGIPKSALHDKKIGNTAPEVIKPGPECVLGALYEKKLVEWILYMAGIGCPITKEQLLNSVQKIMKSVDKESAFKDCRPGKHWYKAFKKRNPEIGERVSENIMSTRADVTEEMIRQWFDRLREYLASKNLLDIDGSRIFNCDESGFDLCPKGQKVLMRRGDRYAYNKVKNNEKECLTVLFSGNAAGQYVPPMIMFSYTRIPAVVAALTPKEYTIGRSDTGWMTATSFFDWVRNSFHPWVVENKIQKPVVLYLDGHSSHLTLQLCEFGRQNGIEIHPLYPNSTYILQPMDVAVFHPLKAAWKKAVPEWRLRYGGERLKNADFGGVLKEAVDTLNWESILRNGFRATGLHPVNPDAINYKDQLKIQQQPQSQTSSAPPKPLQVCRIMDFVEKNIDHELLQAFQSVGADDEWTGDVCHKSLFLFWQKMRNCHERYEMEENLVPEKSGQQSDSKFDSNASEVSADGNCHSFNDENSLPINNHENIFIHDDSDIFEDMRTENVSPPLHFYVSEEGELRPIPRVEDSEIMGDFAHFFQEESDSNPPLDINHNDAIFQDKTGRDLLDSPSKAKASTEDRIQASLPIINLPSTTDQPIPLTEQNLLTARSKQDTRAETARVQLTSPVTVSEGNDISRCKSSPKEPTKTTCPLPSLPSPIKNAVFFPSTPKPSSRKPRPKVQIQSGITSDAWYNMHKEKTEREEKEREEKEQRKLERLKKRELKIQEQEVAKLARSIKKEKNEEEKKRKQELAKAKKTSPNVVSKKKGVKKKQAESKIKGQKPNVAREIKKELIDNEMEDSQDTKSPPAKIV